MRKKKEKGKGKRRMKDHGSRQHIYLLFEPRSREERRKREKLCKEEEEKGREMMSLHQSLFT